MSAVSAHRVHTPESRRHLPAGNGPPELGQVSFIAALIDQNRLPGLLDALSRACQTLGLNGCMGDILPAVIPDRQTVMTAQHVMIRIMGGHKLLDLLIVLHAHVAAQIILIGKTPPEHGVGGKAAQQIVQIDQMIRLGHGFKTPAVIGMEEDQVHLNAHGKDPLQLALKGIPECHAGPVGIPGTVFALFKSIVLRFIVIVEIMLREHAQTHLVERTPPQAFHGFICQRIRLMHQCVDRGAKGIKARAVIIIQMRASGADRTMRSSGGKGFFLKLSLHLTVHAYVIDTGLQRQETQLIRIAARIKARNDRFTAVGKTDTGLHGHLCPGALRQLAVTGTTMRIIQTDLKKGNIISLCTPATKETASQDRLLCSFPGSAYCADLKQPFLKSVSRVHA